MLRRVSIHLASSSDVFIPSFGLSFFPVFLFAYICKGHVGVLRTLLTAGANVHALKGNGATALYIAAQKSERECMEMLLASGASVNTAMDDGTTPLHTAAEKGNIACLQILIQVRCGVAQCGTSSMW
jgi:ankyrin repeat protein